MRFLLALAALAAPAAPPYVFRSQEIQTQFGVVYAVITADVNGDGKPDIVAINPTRVAWFENPTWQRHVILDGATRPDNVAIAAHDIDGDGRVDFALGADWQPVNTESGGSLQWITRGAAGAAWKLTPLAEEPTLHRIRWGDVDGDGKPELIVVPLHGRGNRRPDWQGAGARILVFRVPSDPAREPWPMEVADDSLHIVHNFIVAGYDRDPAMEILTASREGVHVLKRGASGRWSKRLLGEGSPGEISMGRIGLTRYLATVEPWHGNSVVVYEEPQSPLRPDLPPITERRPAPDEPIRLWTRTVVEDGLAQAHALGWGDFDGDGSQELAVGWRDKRYGLAIYRRGTSWNRHIIDDGGMATEDLAIADLDNDGRPDIVAGGRATQNIRIYWNQTVAAWPRHVVAQGFRNQTAVAADFTGDGLADVISNDIAGRRTLLFIAPDWRQVPLHSGVNIIHSAAMDVDADGDIDFIGARYSPGLIFWLERPADPARDAWPFHVVDDFEKGGVNGVHGLLLADVDQDGRLDLLGNSAQPNGRFPNSLAWFRIPAHPRQAPAWDRHIFADRDAPGLSHYLGFGDVDGDGRPDVASAAKVAEGGNWFAWWQAGADPRLPFRRHEIAANQEGATNIHIADLNGDGRADFIATRGHGRGVVWYEAPDWTPHEIHRDLWGPHALDIGDIDGDGDIDAVTCAKDSYVAAWFENDGKGNFVTRVISEDQAAYDIRLVDMDGDRDLDVLIAGQESQNVVWYENRLARRARR